MSDYLVELGQNPFVRKAVQSLGLPLPMPQALVRETGGWQTACLRGKTVLTGDDTGKDITQVLSETGAALAGEKAHGLVFDARKAKNFDDLAGMYSFFHNNIRKLDTCGRVVVVARAQDDTTDATGAAIAAAATGFVKSCAKEIGRKGATANVIYVAKNADKHLAAPLRFFLSPRSAFVDAQPLAVSKPRGNTPKNTWERQLDGKVVLVTGAARGIGAATATRLAAEGATVLGLDIPPAKNELDALMQQLGGKTLACDITAKTAVDQILKAAEPLGGIDVVVNNAGVTRDKTLANMSEEHWHMAINVNLNAALAISEGVLPKFDKDGRVICLSSIAGIAGNFGQTNYGAAKAGLIGAVRKLAPAFSEAGATINAIAPGFIETQMTAEVPFATREAGRRISCLGQGGLPEDVAEAITFLATPAARGINGQILRVCGGSFLGA